LPHSTLSEGANFTKALLNLPGLLHFGDRS
jgi:hypothetical protein